MCVCFDTTFDKLKIMADQKNLTTLQEIREETGCGTMCQLCFPFIETMLKTGQLEFEI